MLSVRIAPSLTKCAQTRYFTYQPIRMQSMPVSSCSMVQKPQQRAHVRGLNARPRCMILKFDISRMYSSQKHSDKDSLEHKFPSKEEIERVAFKVTVTIWDFTYKVGMWLWGMTNKHIIEHPTVQTYWKIFQEKLDKARKDC